MSKCVGIQQIFGDFQQQRINGTLNALTNLTFAIMPFSALTGLWGMNFQGMPELEWEFGYEFFWILAGSVQVTRPVFSVPFIPIHCHSTF